MKTLDLTNKNFGNLTAIRPAYIGKKRGWYCQCSCGGNIVTATSQLIAGYVKTCKAIVHNQTQQIGDIFGKLKIVSLYKVEKMRRWKAECICECGNTKHTYIRYLQRGTVTSCGCDIDRSHFGLPIGEAALNSLISTYKQNAKQKGISFELSREKCIELFQENCYFCGKPPSKIHKKHNVKGGYTYSSIDRIDSSLGYTVNNVASCCTECNMLKLNRNNEEFLLHIKQIYEYSIKVAGGQNT